MIHELTRLQKSVRPVAAILAVMATIAVTPRSVEATDYHHIHLVASDAAEAKQWYMTHMGCTDYGRANACAAGDTQIIFFEREPTGPSVGTGVDHIGFSFTDLAAKMESFEEAGVKILNPIREIDGLFKLAFVEDPWGTKIEVVEDTEWLGFHHLHLRSTDRDATLDWYENIFGGERDSLKGRIAGLRYGTVWFLVTQHDDGELAATQGRAFDHLGWQFPDLRAAAEEIKAKGVDFTLEPRPFTNPLGQDMLISFVEGPDGVRIEIVQPQA